MNVDEVLGVLAVAGVLDIQPDRLKDAVRKGRLPAPDRPGASWAVSGFSSSWIAEARGVLEAHPELRKGRWRMDVVRFEGVAGA